jgi:hypothetical protein
MAATILARRIWSEGTTLMQTHGYHLTRPATRAPAVPASCPGCGFELPEGRHQDWVERKAARRACPICVEVA